MKAPPNLESIEQFLFQAPPYAVYAIPDDAAGERLLEEIYSRTGGNLRIDGHCPFCHRDSTFTVRGTSIPGGDPWNNRKKRYAHDTMTATCVRSDAHTLSFYFRMRMRAMTVEKIVQYPSLATIANDEVAPYRKHMAEIDSSEFHKAIGLAAHGVGVGSFVYLRRVFERLIYSRFEEFKGSEGWEDKDFYGVRMEDKVALLKDHLPAFLVENRRVYSILSIGIHELDEKACLTYFEVMKQAIIIILEDDKKTREDIARRATFAKAIADFKPPEQAI